MVSELPRVPILYDIPTVEINRETENPNMNANRAPSPTTEWMKNHVCTPRGGIPPDYTHEKFKGEMDEFAKRNRAERPCRTRRQP